MIDLSKYNFDDNDIQFLGQIEDWCINGQNEIVLEYKGDSFVLEPHGKEIEVYAHEKKLGHYNNFNDLLLNHKIYGKALIEVIKDLEFGE